MTRYIAGMFVFMYLILSAAALGFVVCSFIAQLRISF